MSTKRIDVALLKHVLDRLPNPNVTDCEVATMTIIEHDHSSRMMNDPDDRLVPSFKLDRIPFFRELTTEGWVWTIDVSIL